ncbi:hypothetical protein D4764_13G0008710 [Takifugu flavidus]|uniref:Uncharacterized protein n=1 Tax=Takifugu flavidus TaxID=433684 RepID=A0A5C6PB36_9TELE|nr:hypothetical protein D4764_13G0008710 [Takifugu flavidus]
MRGLSPWDGSTCRWYHNTENITISTSDLQYMFIIIGRRCRWSEKRRPDAAAWLIGSGGGPWLSRAPVHFPFISGAEDQATGMSGASWSSSQAASRPDMNLKLLSFRSRERTAQVTTEGHTSGVPRIKTISGPTRLSRNQEQGRLPRQRTRPEPSQNLHLSMGMWAAAVEMLQSKKI